MVFRIASATRLQYLCYSVRDNSASFCHNKSETVQCHFDYPSTLRTLLINLSSSDPIRSFICMCYTHTCYCLAHRANSMCTIVALSEGVRCLSKTAACSYQQHLSKQVERGMRHHIGNECGSVQNSALHHYVSLHHRCWILCRPTVIAKLTQVAKDSPCICMHMRCLQMCTADQDAFSDVPLLLLDLLSWTMS